MDYELTGDFGNNKGQNYIELMRIQIEWEKEKLAISWKDLELSYQGKLPSNKPALPSAPTLKQWESNQKKSGRVFVKKGVYRSPRKTSVSAIRIAASINSSPKTEFIYNHYDSFSSEFQGWFDYRNKLLIWEWQLNALSKNSFDFTYLDHDGLTYTEAIFLCLGLNPKPLTNYMLLSGFNMFGRTKFTSGCLLSMWLLNNAPEVELFSRNPKFQKELIPTKDFISWAKKIEIIKSSKSSRTKNAILTNLKNNADRDKKIALIYKELCKNKRTSHLSKKGKAERIKYKLQLPIQPRAIINVINKEVEFT